MLAVDSNLLASELARLGLPPDRAPAFLAANLSDVRSPWTIPGMRQVVERFDDAARQGRQVLLFGDFDTDGATATAVLFSTLARRMPLARRYNPLFSEGYGLQPEQVDRLAAEGVQLIATIDNGITAHPAVARARELGVETILIDHHLPRSDIGPPPTTFVDPPDHVLSASQVGYLVAQALRETWWGEGGHDDWGLALAAVGAEMDWMPLDIPENRGWVAHAQAVINGPGCPQGLAALRQALGEEYTASELMSVGGPLNLGKRIRRVDPGAIVELLLPETSQARRAEIAAFLVDRRKWIEEVEREVYDRTLREAGRLRAGQGLLIHTVESLDPDLAEIEGPLANKLAQATGRPVLALRRYSDLIAFSGRAAGTFSFASFLIDPGVRRVVLSMGGHAKAIGGSFPPDRLEEFYAAAHAWGASTQGQPIWQNTHDPETAPRHLDRLTPEVAYTLARALGPFGHRFRRPVYQTPLTVRTGQAFSGECPVHTGLTLEDGEHLVSFTLSEAWCDGERIGINGQQTLPR